ncbi:MAG: type II toxin-antitoxin system VapB family antitoxin [Pseudomonadota bacterium]
MRTTLTLDDDLLEKASQLTQIEERPALIREALRSLIERESARRLAQLGGTEPTLTSPPRRRENKIASS